MKHVYGKKTSVKAFYLACFGFALFYTHHVWSKPADESFRPIELAVAVGLLLVALGFVAHGFTAHLAVTDDSIETGSIFGKQSMSLDQIDYRREYDEYHDGGDGGVLVSYIEFIPRDLGQPPLKIAISDFDIDFEFRQFVERFRPPPS